MSETVTHQCWCGCGQTPRSPGSRFLPGHDSKYAQAMADVHGPIRPAATPERPPAPRVLVDHTDPDGDRVRVTVGARTGDLVCAVQPRNRGTAFPTAAAHLDRTTAVLLRDGITEHLAATRAEPITPAAHRRATTEDVARALHASDNGHPDTWDAEQPAVRDRYRRLATVALDVVDADADYTPQDA